MKNNKLFQIFQVPQILLSQELLKLSWWNQAFRFHPLLFWQRRIQASFHWIIVSRSNGNIKYIPSLFRLFSFNFWKTWGITSPHRWWIHNFRGDCFGWENVNDVDALPSCYRQKCTFQCIWWRWNVYYMFCVSHWSNIRTMPASFMSVSVFWVVLFVT